MKRSRSLALAVALASGCGHDRASGEGGGSGDGGGTDLEQGRLQIDMRPVHAIRWGMVFEPGDAVGLRSADAIAFAWGDGYPSALEVSISEAWATCGSLQGAFTIESVTASDDDLDVVVTEANAFMLAPAGEGEFEARVRGTFVSDGESPSCAGAEAGFELVVSVPVRRPVGVSIERPSACADGDRFRIESDAALAPGLYVSLVDAVGELFVPSNAASSHPATLVVTAAADTLLGLRDDNEGLAALVVSGAPGLVEVSAFGERQDTFDLVAPADIDVVGVQFELLGNAGGSTPLTSGEVYGEDGWARTTASIGIASSGLEVQGQQVCTLPRDDGFALTSSTPQTCLAYRELGHGVGPIGESIFDPPVPLSAEVIASGVCTLRLDGPEYSDGAGFSTTLSVDIRHADLLYHAGEGR